MTTWAEERREDKRLEAELRRDKAAAAAEERRRDEAFRAEQRRDAAAERDKQAARRKQWRAEHQVELLIYPVAGASAIMAIPAMALFGMALYGPTGIALCVISELGMWAFAIAVERARKHDPPLPTAKLTLGIVVFALIGAGLNFAHGFGDGGSVGRGVVMAIVSVAGVIAHQFVVATAPRTRVQRIEERRLAKAQRVAARRAVVSIDAEGSPTLLYATGAPQLRLRRLALDPFREFGQWRRHTLTATDPAGDPAQQQALARLVAAAGALTASEDLDGDEPQVAAAPRIHALGQGDTTAGRETHALASPVARLALPPGSSPIVVSSPTTAATAALETSSPAAWSQLGAMSAYAKSQITAGVDVAGSDLDRMFGSTRGDEVLRQVTATLAAAPRLHATDPRATPSPSETVRRTVAPAPADSGRPRPAATQAAAVRPVVSRTAVSERRPVSPSGETPSSSVAAARETTAAKMAAYARSQLVGGGDITGAELDRMFGTNRYGAKVLRAVRAELDAQARPAPAGAVPIQPMAGSERPAVADA